MEPIRHKPRTTGIIIGALVLLLSPILLAENESRRFDHGTLLYVHSANGLNLRAKPNMGAPRVARMPYGSRIIVLKKPDPKQQVAYDNIVGHWVYIKFRHTAGYAFSGFLSRFPTPLNGSLRHYYSKLRFDGLPATRSTPQTRTDAGKGQPQSIIIANASFLDGFLIARKLFNMPEKLKFPANNNKPVSISHINHTGKTRNRASLEIIRTPTGQVTEMNYYEKNRKGGSRCSIKVLDNNNIRLQIIRFSG